MMIFRHTTERRLKSIQTAIAIGAASAALLVTAFEADALKAQTPPAGVSVPWHRDIAAAKAASVTSGHQMIVIFTASWNEPSSRFESSLAQSPEATALLGTCFEPTRINVSDDPWTTRRMGISNVPAACIIDDQENVIVRFDCPEAAEGFVSAVCKASREAAVILVHGSQRDSGQGLVSSTSPITAPSAENRLIAPPTAAQTNQTNTVLPNEQLGLEGYCPVSVVTKESWTPGDTQFTSVHDGRTYRFAGEAEQRAFIANPDWYAPAFSGDDTVLASRQGRVVPGKRAFSAAYKSRLYLFSSQDTRNAFVANPEHYTRQTVARQEHFEGKILR